MAIFFSTRPSPGLLLVLGPLGKWYRRHTPTRPCPKALGLLVITGGTSSSEVDASPVREREVDAAFQLTHTYNYHSGENSMLTTILSLHHKFACYSFICISDMWRNNKLPSQLKLKLKLNICFVDQLETFF